MAVVCRYLWTWHLSAYHSFNWVFSWCTSWSTFMSHVTPLSLSKEWIVCHHAMCFFWYSHAAKSFVVSPDVQREVEEVYPCSQNNLCVSTFESVLWLPHSHHSRTLFQVSCRRYGIHHGPPSTRLFLSTSAHHPRNSLRKKFSTLRYVCLNDRFSRSWHRFTSLTFDQ